MTFLAKCIQEHSSVESSVEISRPWRRIPLHVREHEVLILLRSTCETKTNILFIFFDFPRNLPIRSRVLALCGPNMGTTSLGLTNLWPSLVQNLEPFMTNVTGVKGVKLIEMHLKRHVKLHAEELVVAGHASKQQITMTHRSAHLKWDCFHWDARCEMRGEPGKCDGFQATKQNTDPREPRRSCCSC